MEKSSDVLFVSARAAEKIMIHAKGNPANTVAVGVAAACVFVGTAVGCGIYLGGERLIRAPFTKE